MAGTYTRLALLFIFSFHETAAEIKKFSKTKKSTVGAYPWLVYP